MPTTYNHNNIQPQPHTTTIAPWVFKALVIPSKRWLRPDMTEKLLTGTLSINTNKQTTAQHRRPIDRMSQRTITSIFCHTRRIASLRPSTLFMPICRIFRFLNDPSNFLWCLFKSQKSLHGASTRQRGLTCRQHYKRRFAERKCGCFAESVGAVLRFKPTEDSLNVWDDDAERL